MRKCFPDGGKCIGSREMEEFWEQASGLPLTGGEIRAERGFIFLTGCCLWSLRYLLIICFMPDSVLTGQPWSACVFYVCSALLFQEPLLAARVIYDLLFFFIVIIIVLNLIFGVIIDTFADLRSEKQKKEEILKTTCFICGRCPPPLLWWEMGKLPPRCNNG